MDEYVIDLRREFHMYPELSGQEKRTSRRICKELDAIGLPYDIVGNRNVIARLECGLGKALAIRADFDALPLLEQTDVPWKSKSDGVMHACGHDGHTAVLLAAARELASIRHDLHGTIYFCFQQGEEAGIGAADCVDYIKARGGVDEAIAMHLLPLLKTGQMDLASGLRANGAYIFKINIHGTGGHGSRPDVSVNVLSIACDIYQHLVTIPVNRHEASRTCVISPCSINAGSRFNILPDHASIEGTIRFSGMEDGIVLMDKVSATAESIASVYGGSVEINYIPAARYPIINDAHATGVGRSSALKCGFELPDVPPSTGSDNFAEFLHEYPGFYCFIGCRSTREGTSFINHAPNFDFDETALPMVARFFVEYAKGMIGNT